MIHHGHSEWSYFAPGMTEVLGDGRKGTVTKLTHLNATWMQNLNKFGKFSFLLWVIMINSGSTIIFFYLDFNNMAISFVFVQY